MRDIPLPNCSKEFIQDAATKKQRLDGRGLHDYRHIKIWYGIDRGCCQVQIGSTRVMAQVSSEVAEPKLHRPTDGVLYVNVEMSPMTSPSIEIGRPTDDSVEIQRILERTLKESRCLDLESLCIVSSKQVWQIRVDIHCMNKAGNLLDACSIAGIAALAHFRLPDVTIQGEEVTIHSLTERDPIPLSLHHLPICCTFAFFGQGKLAFLDPTLEEEKVMEGKLVIGMNKHRELCCLQSAGSMLLMRDQVMRCSNIAVQKVSEMTIMIQKAQEIDTQARAAGKKFGFIESQSCAPSFIVGGTGGASSTDAEQLRKLVRDEEQTMTEDRAESDGSGDGMDADIEDKRSLAGNRTERSLGEGGPSTWSVEDDDLTDLANVTKSKKQKSRTQPKVAKPTQPTQPSDYNMEEEEEEIVTLQPEALGIKTQTRSPSTQNVKPKKKKKKRN